MVLHGREVEQARLAALVDQARDGRSGTLLIRGEPGVGKSALLADLLGAPAVSGMRVLQTQGLESESPLAFGALHRLLRPIAVLLDRLPSPQSRALRVAFGADDGASVEPFLVGVAVLSLLTEAAEELPVLCVIDDAHWLDAASADALLFAARRLDADRVAIVIAARDADVSTFTAVGIESMVLEGLDPAAVRRLLAEHNGAGLAEEVSQRLLVETGGNPLALLELPVALSTAQLAGTAPLPAQLPVGTGVQDVFLDRVRRLSPPAQTLMLVAAADDTGTLATVLRASAGLDVGTTGWNEAERSGLLQTNGDRVQVRHPLVRSAVYQAASGTDRRRVHRALAAALGADDPDRQAWHRAAAADGPDPEAVAALDRVAARAERRGGYVTAAAAYARAAELSPTGEPRARRRYAAARNAWGSGQSARASTLLTAAREATDEPLLRADIDRLRGRIEVNVGSATIAHGIFISAARAVADLDPARALEMAVAAAVMQSYGADSGTELDVDAIRNDARLDDTPRTRCLVQLLGTMTAAAAGDWSGALEALRSTLLTGRDVTDLDLLGNLGNAALSLGDDQAPGRFYTMMLSSARESGAGMSVVYALHRLAFTQLLSGRWTDLRGSAEEALALSRSMGQPTMTAPPLAWLTLLAALQGRADYDALLAELNEVGQRPLGILTDPVHDLTRWAMGARATHDQDTSAALHQLRRMRLPTLTRMAALDRVEAAIRAGDPEQARVWTSELQSFAEATRWAWALAAVTYARAMIADPVEAPALFESALAHQTRAARPYDEARTRLAYGEFLRRSQRGSTPGFTFGGRWRRSGSFTWNRSRPGPPPSSAPRAKRPAVATLPRCWP